MVPAAAFFVLPSRYYKAGYAYRDRRQRKRQFRLAVDHAYQRPVPGQRFSYSRLINGLKKADIS